MRSPFKVSRVHVCCVGGGACVLIIIHTSGWDFVMLGLNPWFENIWFSVTKSHFGVLL